MTLAHRIEMWICLANEAADLARDYTASFVVDADHSGTALAMRMAAARGQARGLDAHRLPFPAWAAGESFLWLLSHLVDDEAAPAVRLDHVAELKAVSAELVEILAASANRPRADLDN